MSSQTPQRRGKRALYALWELFFPATCVGCGIGGTALLNDSGTRQALCARCTALLRQQTLAVYTPVLRHPVPHAAAAGIYEKTLAQVILSMKNAGRTDAVPELARALGRSVATVLKEAQVPPGTCILLVPAPSTPQSIQRRGYAPADLLVRYTSKTLNRSRALQTRGITLKARPCLELKRASWVQRFAHPGVAAAGQKTLGAQARARRMEGAMYVPSYVDLRGVWCIVCDDVMTTGATAAEASRALKQAGAHVLGTAVIAAVSLQKKSEEEIRMIHP